jgi:hypothetical protein
MPPHKKSNKTKKNKTFNNHNTRSKNAYILRGKTVYHNTDKNVFNKLDNLLKTNRLKRRHKSKKPHQTLTIQRIRINPIQPIKRMTKKYNKYDLDDFRKNSSSDDSGSLKIPKNKIKYAFNVKRGKPLDELDWATDSGSDGSNK